MAHINGCRHRRSRGAAAALRKSPGWRAPAEPAYTRCTMMTVTLLLLLSPTWDTAAEMPLCWPNEACVCEVTTPSTIYLTQRIKQLTTAYSMDAELHLTATDVVITPYMQRRLNATTTMDVDEAVDRITSSGSCRKTGVPSATDMIWEDHTTDESGLMYYCSNCQRKLPWHQYICHIQKAYFLYCCNDYGEMKYFILLRYLNLMTNGYPYKLLN